MDKKEQVIKILERVFSAQDHNDIEKAEAEINALFSPMTVEEIDEVLPKKKENEAETAIEDFACYIYMNDGSVIKGNKEMAEIYNQAIDDCKKTLLKSSL